MAQLQRAAVPRGGDRNEVHRRAADDGRDEAVGRPVVDVLRRRHLLDHALAQHRDAVGHAHRLDLVVGDVDEGAAEVALHVLELGAHLQAQQGVEGRQRLVEQVDARVAHHGPAQRHALALAAGQLARLALQQRLDAQQLGGAADARVALGLRHLALLEREGEVVVDRLVGVERQVLEHDRDVAIAGPHVVDALVVDEHVAGRRLLEPHDGAQERRLAGAGRPEDGHELAVVRRRGRPRSARPWSRSRW